MNVYDTTLAKLKRDILAQKTIYKFRIFLYSINKDFRQHYFYICRSYLENEYNQNTELTATEREILQPLIHHWQWNYFVHEQDWWCILATRHSHSLSLMTLLHLWIDDVEIFEPEAFETSTLGLR